MNQPLFGDKNVGLFGFGERGEEVEREVWTQKEKEGRRCFRVGLIRCRKLERGMSKHRGQEKNMLTFLEERQLIYFFN